MTDDLSFEVNTGFEVYIILLFLCIFSVEKFFIICSWLHNIKIGLIYINFIYLGLKTMVSASIGNQKILKE